MTFIKTDTLARQTPVWGWAVEAEARGSSGKPETPLDMRAGGGGIGAALSAVSCVTQNKS